MVITTKGEKWRSISFKGENILITPLEVKSEVLTDCTAKAEPLTKKQISKGEYKFYTPDGVEYNGEMFKLQDGEAVAKLSATKEILDADIKEDTAMLISDLITEKEYLVKASERLAKDVKDLQRKNLVQKFGFNSGYGFKGGTGVLFHDAVSNKILIKVGRYRRSVLINDIESLQTTKADAIAKAEALKPKVKRVKNDTKV